MIRKFYEFGCDLCGQGEYPIGNNIEECISSYREDGGIVTIDNMTFCSKECYRKYKEGGQHENKRI